MNRPLSVIITSMAAALTTCGFAYGADLTPAPVYRPAPIMSPVPAYSWTGVYVGVNGGGAWGSQDPLNLITNRFDHLSNSISGGLFGGTIGAQVQVSYVVLGLEADLDWANIKGSSSVIPTVGGIPVTAFPINAETKIDWESTARLRAGFAANNIMAYITGGIAVLGAKTTLTTPVGPVCGGNLQRLQWYRSANWRCAWRRGRVWIHAKSECKTRVSLHHRRFTGNLAYQCDTSGSELPLYRILMASQRKWVRGKLSRWREQVLLCLATKSLRRSNWPDATLAVTSSFARKSPEPGR